MSALSCESQAKAVSLVGVRCSGRVKFPRDRLERKGVAGGGCLIDRSLRELE